jgi:hypothetical protein
MTSCDSSSDCNFSRGDNGTNCCCHPTRAMCGCENLIAWEPGNTDLFTSSSGPSHNVFMDTMKKKGNAAYAFITENVIMKDGAIPSNGVGWSKQVSFFFILLLLLIFSSFPPSRQDILSQKWMYE